WGWSTGNSIPREAFALVRQGSQTYEAVVNLIQRHLASWKQLEGLQPNWLDEELKAMTKEVKKHPEFIAAMQQRALTDLTLVDCEAVPAGYFGTDEQRGRRIAHITCRDARGVRNGWPREIGGLTAVVDINEKQVLRIVDEGVVPFAAAVADYDPASIGKPREVPSPIRVDQPFGPGFRLDGYVVEWQKWRFHVLPYKRVWMIVSIVTYRDADHTRPVLYEGYLSEIFVPYINTFAK